MTDWIVGEDGVLKRSRVHYYGEQRPLTAYTLTGLWPALSNMTKASKVEQALRRRYPPPRLGRLSNQ